MSLKELVLETRSYRRFQQEVPISLETLRELVDLARQTASGSNIQPLKYVLSVEREISARIFSCTAWAGYLEDWSGPAEGERPAAYVVILGDTELRREFNTDAGIAAQRAILGISERYKILLVLALGKPAEVVVLEPVGSDGSIRYYRDADDVHHVPKRALEEVVVGQFG